MTDAYDSDDSCNRSDRLEAQIINYKLEDTLPPFVHRRSPSDGGPHGSSPAKGTPSRRSHPNRPDIANYAKEHPLLDWSSADDLDIPPKLKAKKAEAEPAESLPASTDLEREAREALSLIPDESQVEHGGSGPSLIGLGDKVQSPRQDRKDHDPSPLAPVEPVSRTEPTLQNHVHQLPRLSTSSERWISDNIRDTSPLRKYAIPPSERPVQEWLPAPQPASANSPGNSFNLPSLQSALGEQLSGIPPPKDHSGRIGGASTYVFPPVPGSSPPLPRKDLVRERQLSGPLPPPQIPLSPYSHFSPASSNDISNVPSPASQLPSWRPTLKADIRYVTSNFDVSPHASQTAKSPATAYPTPIDQTPAVSEGVPLPTNSTSQSNNVPTSAGTYRCRHPGCTAPPFQTQYLLNSHANVHSQERPHFCPVPGCPRGVGGKGFKRKNEMIRHGFVHDSPGYACPFCPNQQHKYPRPDNLQRHVRVHHVDKSKDDPELRKVLARRPEGSTRGRRRRTNT